MGGLGSHGPWHVFLRGCDQVPLQWAHSSEPGPGVQGSCRDNFLMQQSNATSCSSTPRSSLTQGQREAAEHEAPGCGSPILLEGVPHAPALGTASLLPATGSDSMKAWQFPKEDLEHLSSPMLSLAILVKVTRKWCNTLLQWIRAYPRVGSSVI